MERNIMIAGSYPTIITSGGNPRVNKEFVDNIFLKKYVSILGSLLSIKGKLEDLNIVYVGGYEYQENVSRAKLYLSAYNYFLNYLGYGTFSKSKLTVINEESIQESIEGIEQCDLLLLGIGSDEKFSKTIQALDNRGINLKEIINKKNIFVSSICSGSVMSSRMIYGGAYDSYYYGKEKFNYPFKLNSLAINPVTMETDFCPNDASDEKNREFIENYLKPDSKSCVFFACKPNSLFIIAGEQILAYGEIYLFIDGEVLDVLEEGEKAEVTDLVALVNDYNKVKNKKEVMDNELLLSIKSKVQALVKKSIENGLNEEEEQIKSFFASKEAIKNEQTKMQVEQWKAELKAKLNSLFSEENIENFRKDEDSKEKFRSLNDEVLESYCVKRGENYEVELYLKMNLVRLVKLSYLSYGDFFTDFKRDMFDLVYDYVMEDGRIAVYMIESCGSLFSNRQLKVLISDLKMEGIRPQPIVEATSCRLSLFRKGGYYERS